MAYNFSNTGRPAAPRLYDEEDEDSFWKRVSGAAGAGLSGLGYVGSAIDKYSGGRAIRGLLGGKPRELLSLLPFSDMLGVTDAADAVTGAQLNNKAFGTDANPDLLSLAGAGGIATELLLSPLSFLTFGGGATTKLGQAAAKLGIKPATGALRTQGLARGTKDIVKLSRAIAKGQFDDMLPQFAGMTSKQARQAIAGQSLGGNIGFGLPFGLSPKATTNLASIPMIGKPAGAAVDALGTVLEPLGRYGAAAFRKAAGGKVTKGAQSISYAQHAGEDAARALGHDDWMDIVNTLPPKLVQGFKEGKYTGPGGEKLATMMSDAIERYPGQPLPAHMSWLEDFRNAHDAKMGKRLAAEQEIGLQTGDLVDPELGYLFRSRTPEKRGFGQTPITPEKQAKRLEITKTIPTRGKNSLNELFADPTTRTPLDWSAHIRDNYLPNWMRLGGEPEWLRLKNAKPNTLTPAEVAKMGDMDALKVQADHLADWKQSVGVKDRYYDVHPLEDIHKKVVGSQLKTLKAKELHEGIARFATHSATPVQGTVPLPKVLEDAGLTMNIIGQGGAGPMRGAMQQTLEALRKVTGNRGLQMSDLPNYHIPAEMADEITKITKPMVAPKFFQPVLDALDGITNYTKSAQTTLWPANKSRNQMTALFQHVTHGMFDPTVSGGKANPLSWIKPWQDAKKIRLGGVVGDLNQIPDYKGMTPQQARAAFDQEIVKWDVPGRKMQHSADLADYGGGIQDLLPGVKQDTFGKALSKVKTGWSKKALYSNDDNPLFKAGRATDQYLDDTNRIAAYLAKRRQGFSPEMAKREVLKAHYDYSNLSGFERTYMRRIFPFFSWYRQNMAAMLGDLATKPGGVVGTTLRATASLRGKDPGFVPDWIGSGLAAPIGPEKEGTQRFLSGLGLPVEDLAQFANPLQMTLGAINPLAKYGLEQLTGKQFYSGRDLDQLYSRTGLPQPVENLLMNSPAGRFITTGGTLADSRKGVLAKALNTLTGVRISDVDMDKARRQAGQEYLERMLRGRPNVRFTRPVAYVPRNLRDQASEAEMEMVQLLSDIRRS